MLLMWLELACISFRAALIWALMLPAAIVWVIVDVGSAAPWWAVNALRYGLGHTERFLLGEHLQRARVAVLAGWPFTTAGDRAAAAARLEACRPSSN